MYTTACYCTTHFTFHPSPYRRRARSLSTALLCRRAPTLVLLHSAHERWAAERDVPKPVAPSATAASRCEASSCHLALASPIRVAPLSPPLSPRAMRPPLVPLQRRPAAPPLAPAAGWRRRLRAAWRSLAFAADRLARIRRLSLTLQPRAEAAPPAQLALSKALRARRPARHSATRRRKRRPVQPATWADGQSGCGCLQAHHARWLPVRRVRWAVTAARDAPRPAAPLSLRRAREPVEAVEEARAADCAVGRAPCRTSPTRPSAALPLAAALPSYPSPPWTRPRPPRPPSPSPPPSL